MIVIPTTLIDSPEEYEKEYRIDFNEPEIAVLEERGEYNRAVLREAWDSKPSRDLPVNFQPCAGSFTVVKDDHGNFRLKFQTNIRAQLEAIKNAIDAGFNTIPLFACDFNTFLLSSALGCDLQAVEAEVLRYDAPQVALVFDSRQKMEKLADPGVRSGLLPKAVAETKKLRNCLPAWCQVGVRINTGPLSMACELRGAEIFVDMLDAPGLYSHFMGILTDLYINGRKALQQAAGYHYSIDEIHGDVPAHIPTKGIMVCDDSMILLSPRHYEKYLMPFHRKILNAFGGGCLHSCGDSTHLWPIISGIENLYGFEFGQGNLIDHQKARKAFGAERLLAALDSIFSHNSGAREEAIHATACFLQEGHAMVSSVSTSILQELRKKFRVQRGNRKT